MELLLNLVWLLLALPAFWLWQRRTDALVPGRVSSLQCLLALGCAAVLLFPVISATDDLHAMRGEIEESGGSKRTVRQAGNDKNPARAHRLQSAPAVLVAHDWLPAQEVDLLDILFAGSCPTAGTRFFLGGRAPPSHLLG